MKLLIQIIQTKTEHFFFCLNIFRFELQNTINSTRVWWTRKNGFIFHIEMDLFFYVHKFFFAVVSSVWRKGIDCTKFYSDPTCIHSLHFDRVNESVERKKMINTIANIPEEFFQLNSNEISKCILQSPFSNCYVFILFYFISTCLHIVLC